MEKTKKKAQSLFQDFKKFAFTGNIIDLAVGVMIGGAFSGIVNSLVGDLFMPLIGALTGGLDFTGLFLSLDGAHYDTLAGAKAANASTLNYGSFLQAVFSFLILAVIVFFFVKALTKLRKPDPATPAPRLCPYCRTAVDALATRCPHCTSTLNSDEAKALEASLNVK